MDDVELLLWACGCGRRCDGVMKLRRKFPNVDVSGCSWVTGGVCGVALLCSPPGVVVMLVFALLESLPWEMAESFGLQHPGMRWLVDVLTMAGTADSSSEESALLDRYRVVTLVRGVWCSDSLDDSESLGCCWLCFRREVVVVKKCWKSVDESSS